MNNSVEQVEHTIEMDESLELHATGWTIQRIGWCFFLFVVIMASLGLFGTGILSNKKSEMSGNLVEYERYGRYENITTLRFMAQSENGEVALSVPQEFLEQFELEQVTPEPDRQRAANGHYVYTFETNSTINILMRGMPKKTGSIEATVLVNRTPFTLSQYIFP